MVLDDDDICVPLTDGGVEADSSVPDDSGACPTCECAPGQTRDCPDGSEVGECEVGQEVCGGDGMWGACVGATTPATETCDGRDEDCDGFVDEEITRSNPIVTVATGTLAGFTYTASSPMAVPGAAGESVVFWKGFEFSKGGDFTSFHMQRVTASGAPVGEAIELVSPYIASMLEFEVTAFSRDGFLVVVLAFNYDFDWPSISLGVYALSDLSVVHERRGIRTFEEPNASDYLAFGDLRAAALDSTDAVISLNIEGRTYSFTTAWNPPPASAVAAPAPSPLGEGFQGVDLHGASVADGAWIAYGDGTDVRIAMLDGSGVWGESVSVGAGRYPVLDESGGRIGVLYIDDANHARFTTLSMSSPPLQGAQLDLGAVRTDSDRLAFALTGFQNREQWWIARVGPGTPSRVWLHDVVPDGGGYRARELAFDPGAAGARGVGASVVSERSVLTFTGDSTLRASAYGCL